MSKHFLDDKLILDETLKIIFFDFPSSFLNRDKKLAKMNENSYKLENFNVRTFKCILIVYYIDVVKFLKLFNYFSVDN